MLCNAEGQCSEVCIADGTFSWQANTSESMAAADHSCDEDELVANDTAMANDVRPTLTDINFTVPKVWILYSDLLH